MADTGASTAPTKMKAMYTTVYGAPAEVLSFQDVDKPLPAANEVLIRVVSASTHAGDWHLIRGTPFFIRLLFGRPTKPTIHIPGSDMSGVVEAVGTDVTEFKVDDEVFGDLSESGFGAFAEYVCAPSSALVKKPPNVSFQQAAASPASCFAALQALKDVADVKEGQKVLVNGATGGVGSFSVQIAKAFGAEVTAVGHTDKLDMLREIGADHVIDYTEVDVTTQTGEKYDVVVDAAAYRSPTVFLPIMNPNATYVMIGGSTARFMQMMFLGAWISATRSQKATFLESKPKKKDLLVIQEMLANGKIKPFIDRTYNLTEVPEAIGCLENRQVKGKVVINM